MTTVITINKVQDVYNTPVYEFSESDCLLELNKCLEKGEKIDLEYYRRQMFPSVHIGDFKLA